MSIFKNVGILFFIALPVNGDKNASYSTSILLSFSLSVASFSNLATHSLVDILLVSDMCQNFLIYSVKPDKCPLSKYLAKFNILVSFMLISVSSVSTCDG